MNRRAPARGRRAEAGEALVEFALVLPILLVLTMGMMDFGRAFFVKSLLDQAAREGCRAAVLTRVPDSALIGDRVTTILGVAGVIPSEVNVVGPAASRLVTVRVSVLFKFVTPGVFALIGGTMKNTLNMVGESTMRSEAGR